MLALISLLYRFRNVINFLMFSGECSVIDFFDVQYVNFVAFRD